MRPSYAGKLPSMYGWLYNGVRLLFPVPATLRARSFQRDRCAGSGVKFRAFCAVSRCTYCFVYIILVYRRDFSLFCFDCWRNKLLSIQLLVRNGCEFVCVHNSNNYGSFWSVHKLKTITILVGTIHLTFKVSYNIWL